jgi:hypothetical protein
MSTTETLGLSLALGVILFGMTLLFAWMSDVYGVNHTFLKWLVLPTLGYCVALGLNSVTQYVSCNGSVNINQISLGSIPVVISIYTFLLLTLLAFVRAPIQSALSPNLRLKYGTTFSIAFYMFWAGMFGEAVSGGFAQGCGGTKSN